MSLALKIGSVQTAEDQCIRRRVFPRPRRMYLFLPRPSRLVAPSLHRNKSQGHNSRDHDDTLSSLAV
jgi:hypothetical protein